MKQRDIALSRGELRWKNGDSRGEDRRRVVDFYPPTKKIHTLRNTPLSLFLSVSLRLDH